MIAGVSISLTPAELDRRLSFYDSTRLAHAFDYLLWVAEIVDAKAISVNISLGTNGGAHDGSEALSRWIDSALSTPGRAVTVAAGNAGQENPIHENDLGFLTGRIHTEGRIAAADLTRDLDWIVVGNGVVDLSENELEIWYSAQDRFAVQVRPPGTSRWLRLVEPGEYIENQILSDKTVVSVYNELYHHSNGANKISVFLSPFMTPEAVIGVSQGRWTVRLIGRQVRNGAFHGWIERDDPRPLRREFDREYWRFPSYFARGTNVDRASVSSLACGPRVIAVANLDASNDLINQTSSQGPTRDGRNKPDVAAPGTDILAANGFMPEAGWVRKTGTSMASPFVAGVIGLMMSVNPDLTAAQVNGILHRTARPLPGGTFEWADDAGYGAIDATACVTEARRAMTRKDLTGKAGRVKAVAAEEREAS
jgi:subtilisin family serine protease